MVLKPRLGLSEAAASLLEEQKGQEKGKEIILPYHTRIAKN